MLEGKAGLDSVETETFCLKVFGFGICWKVEAGCVQFFLEGRALAIYILGDGSRVLLDVFNSVTGYGHADDSLTCWEEYVE